MAADNDTISAGTSPAGKHGAAGRLNHLLRGGPHDAVFNTSCQPSSNFAPVQGPAPRALDLPRCPQCDSTIIWADYGEVCSNCGLVISEEDWLVQSGKYNLDRRDYGGWDSKPDQYVALGASVDNPNNLGTVLGQHSADLLRTNPHFLAKRWAYFHLQQQTRFENISPMRLRINILIRQVTIQLQLPTSVKNRTAYRFAQTIKTRHVANGTALAAVLIWAACREFQIPLVLRELFQAFNDMGHKINARIFYNAQSQIAHHPSQRLSNVQRIAMLLPNYFSKIKAAQIRPSYSKIASGVSPQLVAELEQKTRSLVPAFCQANRRHNLRPSIAAAALIYAADRLLAGQKRRVAIFTYETLGEAVNLSDYSIRDIFNKNIKQCAFYTACVAPRLKIQPDQAAPLYEAVGTLWASGISIHRLAAQFQKSVTHIYSCIYNYQSRHGLKRGMR
jgi:transcription initiation factor TFIIIB Brf1 subunit/transcription initiation factor TFIIB